MPPGRRSTRSTLHSEQELPINDSTMKTEHINHSTGKNPQVARRTTRSTVQLCQQTRSTAQSIIQGEHIGPTTPSGARIEQHQAAQSDEPKDNMSSQVQSDQVVKYNPRKATRGMATSKIARAASTGKLSVIFDANCRQPICSNAERFNNEIGFIIRNHGTFYYKEWRLVPEEVRAPLRNYLLEIFDIDLRDETTKLCIDEQMRKAWKSYKYKLHTYFKGIGGKNDVLMAKRKRYPDFKDYKQEDWEMLCDRWCSSQFQERAAKNIENRSKRRWNSKNGSVSTVRHHIRRGMTLTSLTGQIETWRQNQYDENGWTRPELEKLYEDMMNLREIYCPEELPDKEILEMVLGRRSVYLRGWGRSASAKNAKSCHGTSTQTNQPTYQEIVEQLNEAKERLSEVVDILRKNNLMPQPTTSPTNEVSDADLENLG